MKKLFPIFFLFAACVVPFDDKALEDTRQDIEPPEGLSVAPRYPGGALLSWDAVEGAASYSLYSSPDGIRGYTRFAATHDTAYLIEGLKTDTEYFYKVTVAKDNAGESRLSQGVSVMLISLPAPEGVLALPLSKDSISISWDAVEGAASYKVYRAASAEGPDSLVGTTTKTEITDSGLASGSAYFYRICAMKLNTEGPRSVYVSARTPLEVPSGLAASVTGADSVQIIWQAVNGAETYVVYRAVGAGTFTKLDATDGTSFTNTGLTQFTEYRYKVAAVNAGGEGDASGPVTISIAPPSAPGNVLATALSTSSAQLTWDTAAGALSYRIYRSANTGEQGELVGSTADSNWTDTGLQTGTTYFWRITGVNGVLEGAYSAYVSAWVPLAVPAGLTASIASPSSVKITWNEVTGANNYVVYRAIASGDFSALATTSAPSFTDTGLAQLTEYLYKVAASNTGGEGTASAPVSITIAPPSAPSKVQTAVVSETSIQVTWDAVSGASSYKVYCANASNGTYTLIGSPNAASFTHTGVSQGNQYYYKIAAVSLAGEGAASAPVLGEIVPPPPSPPTNVQTAAQSATSITITWNAVTGATSYKIYQALSSGGTYTLIGSPTVASYTHTGLSQGNTYWYKVSAVGLTGEGAQSDPVSGQIKAPPAPSNVRLEVLSSSSIKVSWDAVPGALLYTVYQGSSQLQVLPSTELTVSNLTAGTSYSFQITATNSIGTSAKSASKSAYTQPYPLIEGQWYSGGAKYVSFPVSSGTYIIQWNDCEDGDGTKSGNVDVSGYWSSTNSMENLSTAYFTRVIKGYTTPQKISAPSYGYIILVATLGSFSSSSPIRYYKE